jgi:metallo-beta-lactamase family protein
MLNASQGRIYVDSPLSVNATNIFRLHSECFNETVRQVMLTDLTLRF